MNTVSWIETLLLRELEAFERELSLFPTEELIWRVVPGVSNSSGTLALHVCGNLQHYVGGILGASGYIRDRELEFARRGVSRAALQSEIQRTMHVVREALSSLSPDRLSLEYPEDFGGARMATGLFLLHLSSHLAHHLGQVGYLRRALTGENLSSGAISLKTLLSRRSTGASQQRIAAD
ncbi:MAG: DinB family protein [Thermoanaerobaculia bacterium]